jgi:hypothetical protein
MCLQSVLDRIQERKTDEVSKFPKLQFWGWKVSLLALRYAAGQLLLGLYFQ